VHAQKVRKPPRDLLRALPGVDFVEMRHADICCGAAGLYSTLESDMSNKILDQKMEDLLRTKAEVVSVANPGCQMQLQTGLRTHASTMVVEHLAETIARAY
jgi:glycolate oxidase iron-sulfur subunit